MIESTSQDFGSPQFQGLTDWIVEDNRPERDRILVALVAAVAAAVVAYLLLGLDFPALLFAMAVGVVLLVWVYGTVVPRRVGLSRNGILLVFLLRSVAVPWDAVHLRPPRNRWTFGGAIARTPLAFVSPRVRHLVYPSVMEVSITTGNAIQACLERYGTTRVTSSLRS